MITLNGIIAQAPPGYHCPQRVHGGESYIVTGWYPDGAPNNKEESCYRAPALVLDFDLVDFFIKEKGLQTFSSREYKKLQKEQKKLLYSMNRLALKKIWSRFMTHTEKIFSVLKQKPTVATISGWGIHALYWLPDDAGYKDDNEWSFSSVRSFNAHLVQAINITAGYEAADPAVHDAGTRLLRQIGSTNNKAQTSIKVRRLDQLCSDKPADMARLKHEVTIINASTGILKRTAPAPAPAPAVKKVVSLKFASNKLDFSSLKVSTGQRTVNLQILANTLKAGEKIDIVCPFGGNSVGGAFVVGAATLPEQKLVSNNTGTVYGNQVQAGVAALDKHSKTGRTLSSFINCYRILSKDNRVPVLWFDTFRQRRMYDDERLEDKHYRKLKLFLIHLYGVSFSMGTLKEAVKTVCEEREQNPLTDWLEGLQWDGVPRLESWLHTVTGCDDTPLNKAYSRCFLLACIARAMKPGCKADNVLCLQGKQGSGKSTLFRVLAGDEYFSDTYINIGKKDAFMQLHNAWIYEMAELDSFYRKDASQIKSFLTSPADEFRPPYAEEMQVIPRHTIIVGTTNEAAPLKDDTGNRRFFLVPCPPGKFNLSWLAAHREQLWAEALRQFELGAHWWLSPEEEELQEDFNSGFVPASSAEHFLLWWLRSQLEASPARYIEFRAADVLSAFQDDEQRQIIRPPSAKLMAQLLLCQDGMTKTKTKGLMTYRFEPAADWEGFSVFEPLPLKLARQRIQLKDNAGGY